MTNAALTDADRALLFGDDGLSEGDAVVHFEHGLAAYGGKTTVEVEGEDQHLTVFIYRNGGKLMLPAEEGRDFWRYGAPAADLTLDRLDADDWVTRRDEIIEELRDAIDRLVAQDRKRRAETARRIDIDPDKMRPLLDSFGHDETPDQARAIDAVMGEIASEVPMNHLLIADVGFGKTEVALRAVAATALSGFQAAVVAPTTILARQHFETLERRLSPLDIDVVELSRLTSGADRTRHLEDIAAGRASVVVATQALLSDDVEFADLALLVLDEEQKFGRDEKAAFRALSPGCHVLSLTATPIPRSLALAEVGLVEVSLIATPPTDRTDVATEISKASEAVLQDSISAEIARDGQCYIVCPRISDLDGIEQWLAAQTPPPSYAVAHGQMSEEELETEVLRFTSGEVQVLLSTSLVESGLDNPRANTMVVFHADRFGLAQLHQLRGRIGRSDVSARMLLLTDAPVEDDEAHERLNALTRLSGLGDGFRLARKDRELRGFGELDGDAQSGQISRLGLGLYRHILRDRVARLAEKDEG